MQSRDLSQADLVQWVRVQIGIKHKWLDEFGVPGRKFRGSLETSQKQLDIVYLTAIERALIEGGSNVGTDEKGNSGRIAAGSGDAGEGLPALGPVGQNPSEDSGEPDRLPEGRLL